MRTCDQYARVQRPAKPTGVWTSKRMESESPPPITHAEKNNGRRILLIRRPLAMFGSGDGIDGVGDAPKTADLVGRFVTNLGRQYIVNTVFTIT